jgi:hypothetical protein
LTKNHAYSQETNPSLQSGCYVRIIAEGVAKKCGRENQSAWHKKELNGGKPPVDFAHEST